MSNTIEDWLIEQHELYMQQVTESGMPQWVADMYTYGFSYAPEANVEQGGIQEDKEIKDNMSLEDDDLPF